MPLGIVNDDDFLNELDNSTSGKNNPLSGITTPIIKDIQRGRGIDSVEVPDSLRKIIGETSSIEGRQSAVELADRFGISPSSVSAYANGSTSTASYDKQPNLSHINDAKDRISKKARRKLILAINSITEQNLSSAKVNEVASVARSMAAIIKDMEPDSAKSEQKVQPQFIFYAPQVKEEKIFDVIYAKE